MPSKRTASDVEEQAARIEKLRVESDSIAAAEQHNQKKRELEIVALRQQLSRETRWLERIKALASAGGSLTAFAAIFGIALSILQWRENSAKAHRDRDEEQEDKREERLNKALALLPADREAARLTGVASLQSFFGDSAGSRQRRALVAIANHLGVEESVSVRHAILSSLELALSTAPGPDAATFEQTMDALVTTSRAVVAEGNLLTSTKYGSDRDDSKGVQARARSVGEAIVVLLNHNVKHTDFSGVYLADLKLSMLALDGSSFERAVLLHSDFDGVSCVNCDFLDANVTFATFVSADLRHTKFGYKDELAFRAWLGRRAYEAGQAEENLGELIVIGRGGDFSCADLSGAIFQKWPLFNFTPNELFHSMQLRMGSFERANLADSDFSQTFIVSMQQLQPTCLPFEQESHGGYLELKKPKLRLWFGAIDNGIAKCSPGYERAMTDIKNRFANSNTVGATIPDVLRRGLENSAPNSSIPLPSCVPRND